MQSPARRAPVRHWLAAGMLAVVMLAATFVYGTKVAGGADSFGYLSQADLWLAGNLEVAQPFAAEVPWPDSSRTFSPLGYRPAIGTLQDTAIVPTYSPGLPLLFATAKRLGGHDAMFWVVPIASALLVWTTFALGCRLASPTAGVIGAWLVATSPAVLYMAMSPMSDVPAATVWAVAFLLLLGATWRSAAASGLVAAIATPVRPNLAPLAVVLGSFHLLGALPRDARRRELIRAGQFAAGALIGIVFVGVLFTRLYGSPLTSGYGRLVDIYSPRRIPANFRNYLVWLVSSQTPVALAGLAAVMLPAASLWPAAQSRRAIIVAAAFVVTLWLLYLPYLVFEEWWYLRFLLGAWPFLMLGTGALAAWVLERSRTLTRVAVLGSVILLGLLQLRFAIGAGAFDLWKAEARYPAAAAMARRHTEDGSVILSMQHSGSVRYYGGRMTMRYDRMKGGWFDPAMDWLEARGVHPYLLLDDWELALVKRRLMGARAAQAIDRPPLAVYDGPGGNASVYLFDLAAAPAVPEATEHVPGVQGSVQIPPPVPSPQLVFHP